MKTLSYFFLLTTLLCCTLNQELDLTNSAIEVSANPFLENDNFREIVRLTYLDNKLVQSYKKGSIDSSDLVALFISLDIPENYWFAAGGLPKSSLGQFMNFVNSKYPSTDLPEYFSEVNANGYKLNLTIFRKYSHWPHEKIRSKMSDALPLVLDNIIKERQAIQKTDDCANCHLTYDVCLENNRLAASGVLLTGAYVAVQVVGYTGYMGPVSWGTAGVSLLTGVVGGGITYAIGYTICDNSLDNCLRINECGGGGRDGSNPLIWVNKS